MISSTQMRPGMVIKFNNELYSIFSVNHRTPGNLRGFVQAKMRSLRTGTMAEHRFSSEDKWSAPSWKSMRWNISTTTASTTTS